MTTVTYQSGFGNHFATEAVAGSLPQGQNSPQRVPHGLFAEQINGAAFSAQRPENLRSWVYRIRPSVLHSGSFTSMDPGLVRGRPFQAVYAGPDQLRWDPLPVPTRATDFVEGLVTIAGNGSDGSWRGCAVHLYAINQPMGNRFFYDADGELLMVPEQGSLEIKTEFGTLQVKPGEICVIPRGVRMQVSPAEGSARGYICENYGLPLRLPYLGVIGSNGLANPRDFLYPTASYEDRAGSFQLVAKFQGQLWSANIEHSPLDVVAWHGNYGPYKYDLTLFNVINTVSFDHTDPSIFTVLTSPSEIPGVANVDFVIFPPRWTVAEHTFRPPYFHRNVMSEYMGLIFGNYEAKQEGFIPGGGSLHNSMSAHGPDAETYNKAVSAELEPQQIKNTLAFMFESSLVFNPTEFAMKTELLQKEYLSCWKDLRAEFKTP